MKFYHYAIIFVIFAIAIVAMTDLKVSEKNYMAENTEVTNTIFDRAVVAATDRLLDTEEGASQLKREEATVAFFDSLYASFGITDMPLSRENMALYVPVICVTEPDGFYICFDDIIYGEGGGLETRRCWTEKKTFTHRESSAPAGYRATGFVIRFLGNGSCYVDDAQGIVHGKKDELFIIYLNDFLEECDEYAEAAGHPGVAMPELEYYDIISTLYGPKNYWSLLTHGDEFRDTEADVRAKTLEENLAYYCNAHNYVAQQNGVLYSFSIPSFDAETYLRATNGTSFIAFFQGYPVPGTDEVFNRFSISSAEVEMIQMFYIDADGIYHRSPECAHASEITDTSSSQYGCAQKGAFACDYCFPDTGAHK